MLKIVSDDLAVQKAYIYFEDYAYMKGVDPCCNTDII